MHAARRLLLPAHTAWAPAADAPAAEQGGQAAPAGGCQPTGGWLWAPRPLGERARRAWRTRLDAALEPCTSLLGGMWSPTTLPARLPQWWHPSLRARASVCRWHGRTSQRHGTPSAVQ